MKFYEAYFYEVEPGEMFWKAGSCYRKLEDPYPIGLSWPNIHRCSCMSNWKASDAHIRSNTRSSGGIAHSGY
jgi:hypothetical protein